MDDDTTWKLIHHQRAALADILAGLSAQQWAAPSLCGAWPVQVTAGHVVVGAEQSTGRFVTGLVTSGFRFNTMVDRDAQRAGADSAAHIVERLRDRLTTTNRPPAPVVTMLGEVVVHGLDICQPLGVPFPVEGDAMAACLDLYQGANFPVGTKKRIAGLHLAPADVGWTHGEGPGVTGPAASLLLAMTGRPGGLSELSGDGVAILESRMG
jgi:uncharacterized protein (TIGR03083 family)